MVQVKRSTKETDIVVSIPDSKIAQDNVQSTGDTFLDHMLETLSKYSKLNFSVQATGDLAHHISEDIAITLGVALRKATPDACVRYAEVTIPMDDALVQVCIDLVERNYYEGPIPNTEFEHFFRSLAENYKCNIHIRVIRGFDEHHIIEAAFKALGICLSVAMSETENVFSTKGSAQWTIE